MGISIGLVGLGSFGGCFAPLFKSHPLVSRIGLCDREPALLARFARDPFYADKLSARDCYTSLDDICRADFDALAIITQPWLHEFVSAVAERRQPAINVWEAVRYMAMGVAAHQSALKGGETVAVPDWGDTPA